jgi:hypothetical protein
MWSVIEIASKPSRHASSTRAVAQTDPSQKTACACRSHLRVMYPRMSGMRISCRTWASDAVRNRSIGDLRLTRDENHPILTCTKGPVWLTTSLSLSVCLSVEKCFSRCRLRPAAQVWDNVTRRRRPAACCRSDRLARFGGKTARMW